jgi:hypothetical protein
MEKGLLHQQRTEFLQKEWPAVVEYTARGLRLSEEEQRWLAESRVAQYIAAIPYAAGCTNPDRMAIMLLVLFVVEIRGGSPFDTRSSDMDGSLARIEPYFEPLYAAAGDADVIDRGKYILGMKTFSHWIEDPEAHPTHIDFLPLRYQLKVKIEGLPPNELLDSILTVDDGMVNMWSRTDP